MELFLSFTGKNGLILLSCGMATCGLLSLYLISVVVYNLFFHPLHKFKGPPLWCASRLCFITSLIRGNLVTDVRRYHERYGDIVRLAPNELSFAREDAWRDVFTKREDHSPLFKNPIFFKAPPGQPENMITTTIEADNLRMRKLLAPGFAEQAVLKQENVVQYYVHILIDKLTNLVNKQESKAGVNEDRSAVIDMVKWYNFCTFDIIGDLGLGESFGSLKSSTYHPWISLIFNFLKGMTLAAATRYYPLLELLLLQLLPPSIKRMQREHYQFTVSKTHRRMNLEKQRDDFMTPVLKDNPDYSQMSLSEIESTFALLIIAGSETTATVLSGITNELVKAPAELQKLVAEIRSTFSSSSEMTFAALRPLPFLNAVCQEGLRLCNPVPGGLPRVVPIGGATICGHFLPENTNVTISPTALSFSPTQFSNPNDFLPERFLPASHRPAQFAADRRSNQHPFGLGPRSCIGKPLALAQLRLILAKIIWHFDIEAVPGRTLNWTSQKTYIVVEKQPVYVRLKLRQ